MKSKFDINIIVYSTLILLLIITFIFLIRPSVFTEYDNLEPSTIPEIEKELSPAIYENVSIAAGGGLPEIEDVYVAPKEKNKEEQKIIIQPEPYSDNITIDNIIENNIIFPSTPTTTQQNIVQPIVEQKIIYVPVETKPVTTTPVEKTATEPVVTATQPLLLIEKKDMSSLEIISPIERLRLGREYIASEQPLTEANSVYLGLVVRDEDGNPTSSDTVVVTTTDETQNKTIKGTGNVTKIWVNGSRKEVHYYPYEYNFKTTGTHTITFEVNGMIESVSLEVNK